MTPMSSLQRLRAEARDHILHEEHSKRTTLLSAQEKMLSESLRTFYRRRGFEDAEARVQMLLAGFTRQNIAESLIEKYGQLPSGWDQVSCSGPVFYSTFSF